MPNRTQIEEDLIQTIRNKWSIDFDITDEKLVFKDLLGMDFNLMARDLLWLHFYVEDKYKIMIPELEVNHNFRTIYNIAKVVASCLNNTSSD